MSSLYRNGAAVAALLLVLASCSRSAPPSQPVPEGPDPELGTPDALLSLANGPLWFELTANGPSSIAQASDAALGPFEPWPLVKRVTGFCLFDGRIVAPVNREGFLAFALSKDGYLRYYRKADEAVWGSYSVGPLFTYHGRPSVLLYRDSFFSDTTSPSLEARLRQIPTAAVAAADLPALSPEPEAFKDYPAASGWDIQSLEISPEGSWLFKALRQGESGGEVAYGRASNLDSPCELSSAGAYQQAQLPFPAGKAEGLLSELFKSLIPTLSDGELLAVDAISASTPLPVSFLLSREKGKSPSALLESSSGDVARAWACVTTEKAWLLRSDGRLVVCSKGGGIGMGALPSLDQGFVYTGLAAAGEFLVASWEEQDGWAVGSAGFVVLRYR